MKSLLIVIAGLLACQLLFSQTEAIKLADSVFENSFVVRGDFTVKINNCNDTFLNAAIADIIYSKRNDFKLTRNFLCKKDLLNFTCSPTLDSLYLIDLYNVLQEKEKINHKICIASFFTEKNKSVKIIYLRLFTKKRYKRYLRMTGKIKITSNDISGKTIIRNLRFLFKKTSTYIVIIGIHLTEVVEVKNNR